MSDTNQAPQGDNQGAGEGVATAASEGAPNRRQRAPDLKVVLETFGYSHLPEVFSTRNGDNSVSHESNPCYLLRADGFYGKGLHGTLYQEGDMIVLDGTPNHHLEPLNRAAAMAMIKWLQSLPTTKVAFDIADMAEAARVLAKDPRVQGMEPEMYQAALIDLCQKIKIKRLGGDVRTDPGIGHNFAPGGSKTMPILGARVSKHSQRGMGGNHPSMPQGGAESGARRVSPGMPPAMGGPTPIPR